MKISAKLPKGFKKSEVVPLSLAIKLGSKGSKQITGNFVGIRRPKETLDLVCALGAGLKGVGLLEFYKNQLFGDEYIDGFYLADYLWPYSKKHVKCPVSKCLDFDANDPDQCLNALIAHLNDQHKWSFRKIYNFVKKVENQFAKKLEKGK